MEGKGSVVMSKDIRREEDEEASLQYIIFEEYQKDYWILYGEKEL